MHGQAAPVIYSVRMAMSASSMMQVCVIVEDPRHGHMILIANAVPPATSHFDEGLNRVQGCNSV